MSGDGELPSVSESGRVQTPVERVLDLDCRVYVSGSRARVEFDADEFVAALGLTREAAAAWVARNL